MKTVIYYYSGTGNSLWAARTLAARLGDTEIVRISATERPKETDADCIGLAFPIHMWGPPAVITQFARRLKPAPGAYLFALATNAGQPATALPILQKALSAKGLKLSAGFSIVLPSNYTPFGGPGTAEKMQTRFDTAREKLAAASDIISKKQIRPLETGSLFQRLIFPFAHRMSAPHVRFMDKSFWSDQTCNGCGICARVCPAANIVIENKRPSWRHRCEQCYACLQWCPHKALQSGNRTAGRERYHHPEISIVDMFQRGPE